MSLPYVDLWRLLALQYVTLLCTAQVHTEAQPPIHRGLCYLRGQQWTRLARGVQILHQIGSTLGFPTEVSTSLPHEPNARFALSGPQNILRRTRCQGNQSFNLKHRQCPSSWTKFAVLVRYALAADLCFDPSERFSDSLYGLAWHLRWARA